MSKKYLLSVSLLFLIVLSAHTRMLSQNRGPAYAAIDGSIVLTTNQPMERYEILLLSKDGEQVISRTYTDLAGRYRFTNLIPDSVDVVVRIEGFEEARVPVKLTSNMSSVVNIMLSSKASTVVQPDQWEAGVVSIEELSRKYPRKAVEDFQKAADSKRKGDTMKAMELLEGVVKLTADFSEAHNLLGTVYQGMERYRDGETQYNLSRSLSPNSVLPLVNLATLYLQEAQANYKEGPFVTGVMYDDALHILQDAAKMDPNNATVVYLLGVTFYRQRSFSIAEKIFNVALGIDEHMGSARLALANIYIQQQKWKDALNQFDTYLSENPKGADRSQVEAIRLKVIKQL